MGLKSDHGQRHSPRIASEYYSRTNTVSNFSSLFLHKIPFFCIHVTSIRIFFARGYVCLFYLHVPQRSKNRASVVVKKGLHSIYDILTFSEFPLRCSPMGTSMAHGYAWLAISSEWCLSNKCLFRHYPIIFFPHYGCSVNNAWIVNSRSLSASF